MVIGAMVGTKRRRFGISSAWGKAAACHVLALDISGREGSSPTTRMRVGALGPAVPVEFSCKIAL